MLPTAVPTLFCRVANRLYLLSNLILRFTISILYCYLEIFSCSVAKTALAMRDRNSSGSLYNSSRGQADVPNHGAVCPGHGSPEGVVVTWEWFDFFGREISNA